ncbi:hypothetical protein N7541_000801 [Penicillium brevicompactum]|uniref:Quinate repressor protein n=1 Tax=Penicillium brevicompactum TaxID=5074 RepID=A0A9W9RUZ0_PENBR|nr:hypothetical protein N7541_000801 [Penicillium brevicompactum]
MARDLQTRTSSKSSESPAVRPGIGSQKNASILIVGIRGTGKTSLAILAAAALGLGGVVDADHHFLKSTTLTRAKYVSIHGFENYREKELALMQDLLREHPTRRLIVGGPGFAQGTSLSQLEMATMGHPIIFIMRDAHEIDNALNVGDAAKVSRIQETTCSHYRSLSSFEFYNLSEPRSMAVSDAPQKHSFLALKHAENDFVRLVHEIWNRDPFSRHSYALVIPIGSIADISCRLSGTDLLADAVQLVVPMDVINSLGYLEQSTATYITRQYYLLRRHVKLPVIFHLQVDNSQIQRTGFWESYANYLSHGLRLAPEYVSLNLDCEADPAQSILCRRGSTKVIGDFTSSTTDPAVWGSSSRIELVRKAEQWGCDLVRISQECARPEDNRAVQRFFVELDRSGGSSLPIIAYNTGALGRSSCLGNRILTPVTHDIIKASESVRHAKIDTDELLTVQQAQRALFASFELDRLVFGVFGSAEESSMAPMMHNAAFAFCGMPHEFIQFSSQTLDDIRLTIQQPEFGGAAVRYPFKQEILSLVDHFSPEAQAIQAVNLIVALRQHDMGSFLLDRNRAGPVMGIFGDNTDWIGIYRSIQRNLSPINAAKRHKSALIIGAGGMARAAVYACLRLEVDQIFIQNRTYANAEQLVRQFDAKAFPLHQVNSQQSRSHTSMFSGGRSPSDLGGSKNIPGPQAGPASVRAIYPMSEPRPADAEPPTIIISSIPRFLEDEQVLTDSFLHDSWLMSPTGGVAVDVCPRFTLLTFFGFICADYVYKLAYTWVDTPFLRQIGSLNREDWVSVNGLQVLPEQGFAQFELFTGRKAPQNLMRSSPQTA